MCGAARVVRRMIMADGIGEEVAPWPALFAPEERLGWSFTDRDQFRRAFAEPQPSSAPPGEDKEDRLQAARRKLPGRLAWTWRFALVGSVVGWTVLVRDDVRPDHHLSPQSVLISGAIGAAVAAVVWVGLLLGHLSLVRRYGSRRQTSAGRRHGAAAGGLVGPPGSVRRARVSTPVRACRSGSRPRPRGTAASMWSAGTCGGGRRF